MPSYTPEQAAWLRSKLLVDLDSGEPSVDIDFRFIRPLFGSEAKALEWASSWNLTTETYAIPSKQGPSTWLRFSHPSQPLGLCPPDDDTEL